MTQTITSKIAKRDEPELQIFESASTDRMAQMLLVMAAELHVLRDRMRCLEFILTERGIAHERGKAGSCRLETFPHSAPDFSPTEGAVRDDAGPGRLGQVHRHLEVRGKLEHIHLPAAFAAFQGAFLKDG